MPGLLYTQLIVYSQIFQEIAQKRCRDEASMNCACVLETLRKHRETVEKTYESFMIRWEY